MDGLGFACGERSGVTVLDVDSRDDRLLADAFAEYGPTPVVVRSGSGNFQGWYRHNGEGRKIRPDKTRPIDILGSGYVVAPPSRTPRGDYELISGSLDDLRALPALRLQKTFVERRQAERGLIERGERNNALWRLCMVKARECLSQDQLQEVATVANFTTFHEPLDSSEVDEIVASAWRYQLSGKNRFGRPRTVQLSDPHFALMDADPDAFSLLLMLQRHHLPDHQFFCANSMAGIMPGDGWALKRFAAARQRLEACGRIQKLRPPLKGVGPALYRFGVVENDHQ
jgi:hypothetical protein